MFLVTLKKRCVFKSTILALTMTLLSTSAQASLISYDLSYIRGDGITLNNTEVDVTITLDDANILPGGGAVALSTIDVIFRQGIQEIPFSFDNDRTNTLTGAGAFNATFNPFEALFVGNTLTGLIGWQPLSGIGIASLKFATPVPIPGGSQASTRYIGSNAAFGEFNSAVDLSPLSLTNGVSGPFAVIPAVPVPAGIWLFGTALIGLVGFSKRRKAV